MQNHDADQFFKNLDVNHVRSIIGKFIDAQSMVNENQHDTTQTFIDNKYEEESVVVVPPRGTRECIEPYWKTLQKNQDVQHMQVQIREEPVQFFFMQTSWIVFLINKQCERLENKASIILHYPCPTHLDDPSRVNVLFSILKNIKRKVSFLAFPEHVSIRHDLSDEILHLKLSSQSSSSTTNTKFSMVICEDMPYLVDSYTGLCDSIGGLKWLMKPKNTIKSRTKISSSSSSKGPFIMMIIPSPSFFMILCQEMTKTQNLSPINNQLFSVSFRADWQQQLQNTYTEPLSLQFDIQINTNHDTTTSIHEQWSDEWVTMNSRIIPFDALEQACNANALCVTQSIPLQNLMIQSSSTRNRFKLKEMNPLVWEYWNLFDVIFIEEK